VSDNGVGPVLLGAGGAAAVLAAAFGLIVLLTPGAPSPSVVAAPPATGVDTRTETPTPEPTSTATPVPASPAPPPQPAPSAVASQPRASTPAMAPTPTAPAGPQRVAGLGLPVDPGALSAFQTQPGCRNAAQAVEAATTPDVLGSAWGRCSASGLSGGGSGYTVTGVSGASFLVLGPGQDVYNGTNRQGWQIIRAPNLPNR